MAVTSFWRKAGELIKQIQSKTPHHISLFEGIDDILPEILQLNVQMPVLLSGLRWYACSTTVDQTTLILDVPINVEDFLGRLLGA